MIHEIPNVIIGENVRIVCCANVVLVELRAIAAKTNHSFCHVDDFFARLSGLLVGRCEVETHKEDLEQHEAVLPREAAKNWHMEFAFRLVKCCFEILKKRLGTKRTHLLGHEYVDKVAHTFWQLNTKDAYNVVGGRHNEKEMRFGARARRRFCQIGLFKEDCTSLAN